jgi:AcrR family transcriptional regulator
MRLRALLAVTAAAAELISPKGYEAFTIEALATKAHCPPATIYRHAGGKAAILDAVVAIQSARTSTRRAKPSQVLAARTGW